MFKMVTEAKMIRRRDSEEPQPKSKDITGAQLKIAKDHTGKR